MKHANGGNEPTMGGREWVMLLALAALWGSSFFFFKVMVGALPPLTVVLARVGIAALLLNAWLAILRDFMPASARTWAAFIAMGLLNNILPFALVVFGETRISSGLASILNATTPMFTVLAANWLTTNEKFTVPKAFGFVLGFVDVAVLIGPDALSGFANGDVLGEAACLLAAISYAFAGVYGRRFKGMCLLKTQQKQSAEARPPSLARRTHALPPGNVASSSINWGLRAKRTWGAPGGSELCSADAFVAAAVIAVVILMHAYTVE